MKSLAALLMLAPPALAGDLEVVAVGTVVSGTAPTSGPLAGAAIGDPVTFTFEVDLPVQGSPASSGTTFTWMDNGTFELNIGGAIDGHRFPAGGLCWWVDDFLGLDGIQVREEALATPGLRVRMRLHDLSQSVFSEPDPLLYVGTYGPSTFDDVTWSLLGTSNLAFDLQSVTISAPPIGTNYCGPAVPNSAGVSATIEAIGSDRLAGRRVRLLARSMPRNAFGFVLVSRVAAFVPQPGNSQGNLCLGGSIGRYAGDVLDSGAAGAFAHEVDPFSIAQPTGSIAAMAGETWRFQAWFRDANPASTSNFTDGVAVTFR